MSKHSKSKVEKGSMADEVKRSVLTIYEAAEREYLREANEIFTLLKKELTEQRSIKTLDDANAVFYNWMTNRGLINDATVAQGKAIKKYDNTCKLLYAILGDVGLHDCTLESLKEETTK